MRKIEKLVSIVVVAYNSSETILETLDSIKDQTHRNIELIVTDDCSTDNTYKICEKWINENKDRFYNTSLIKTTKNGGVTLNVNNGCKKCEGEYIVTVAGDDILEKKCIELNYVHMEKNKNINILFSKVRSFKIINEKKVFFNLENSSKDFFDKSASEQFKFLLKKNFISAPSAFFRSKIFLKYGYFDERFSMMEDYPYWFKLTKEGEKLYFLDENTVYYRIGESLTSSQKNICNIRYFDSYLKFYKLILKDYLKFYKILHWHIKIMILKKKIGIKIFKNKKNIVSTLFLKIVSIVDFYRILEKIEEIYEKYKRN